jgi:alkanesulfonate monooxygenase SsuD/methylene tetrahydromethanopterin reductase-like flavin-dependent oxidoreductase (luciferase family)
VACAERPIPVLSAAVSSVASRRAATVGAGILMEGVSSLTRLANFCRAYDDAGGTAGKVLIRRVWLGKPLEAIIESQRRFYQSFRADGGELPEDQTIAVDDPAEMADRLAHVVKASGSDCINIRVHLPGIPAPDIRDQIVRLGEEMVPRLRTQLAPST